jgi:DNA-binding PadR family transcriptional regulator
MPIHHAVLALLADGPSHGYELKASFEEAIGPQWGELNIGHLYQVLDRLERDGFVTRRVVRQDVRPDRIDYRLTVAGRHELSDWLLEPGVRQGGYRDDFFLQLFAAARSGPESLQTVLHNQRSAHLSELRTLSTLRSEHHDDPLVALLIEAATLHIEANLRVVDLAEQRAAALSESTRRRVRARSVEPARRRPTG